MEKIVIMVLITLTMGQAKDDLDTMKEMMAEMNERLVRTEAELASTKDDLAITKAKETGVAWVTVRCFQQG